MALPFLLKVLWNRYHVILIQFKQVRRRDQWELSDLITPRPLAKLFNPMKLIYNR